MVEVVIRVSGSIAAEEGVNQAAAEMCRSGFMLKLLEGLHGSWSAHCTTGPLAETPLVDGVVETDYFAVLARIIMGSTTAFCQSVQTTMTSAGNASANLEPTMKWLLEEWFGHFDNVGDPSRRKLMCLALTKLLETNQAWILVNLQSLMTMWTDVVCELSEGSEDLSADSLVANDTGYTTDGPRAPGR